MEEEWTTVDMDYEKNKALVQKMIAKRLLDIHGDKAFMLVLMEMDGEHIHPQKVVHWREILTLMEEMKGETK
jgi:hypothetical protein